MTLNLDTIKAAMASTNAIFDKEVIGKRNFAALDDIYTADARILPPGAPMISGISEIRKFWMGLVESVNASSGALESVDVLTAGEGVVEIGAATLTMQPAGQAAPSQLIVKYVVFWKEDGGTWKWHVDIWNTNA
jgi:ketosteroid isomerase-like protein